MTSLDVFEAIDSQDHLYKADGKDRLTLRYLVTGTDDRDVAYAALWSNVPNVDLLRGRFVVADTVAPCSLGPNMWEFTITYTPIENKEAKQPKRVGEVTFDFDGTGGTFQSFEAHSQTKYGANAPDHGNAINVTSDGVQGVEIVRPKLAFTLTQKFAGSTITMRWLRQISLLTGTTNAAPFMGFQPGEVLFLGPSGQQPFHFTDAGTVVAGDREVTYRYAVSPNRRNFTVADIQVSEKRGHDYLWVAYQEQADSSGKALTRKPIGVYVAAVYEPANWAPMGVRNPDFNHPVAA